MGRTLPAPRRPDRHPLVVAWSPMSPQTPPPTPGNRDPQGRPGSGGSGGSGGRPTLTGGWPRWALWVLAGGLLAALFIAPLMGGEEGDEISYAEFMAHVEAGEV